MHLNGKVNITKPPEVVWDFLIDYHNSSQCIPGLQSLEEVVPGEKFRAEASFGLGSVRVTFNLDVEWLELMRPNSAKMKIYGRAPGNVVNASSEMNLVKSQDGGTDLEWCADIVITGTIGSIATRIIPGEINRLATDFFKCVQNKIEGIEKPGIINRLSIRIHNLLNQIRLWFLSLVNHR